MNLFHTHWKYKVIHFAKSYKSLSEKGTGIDDVVYCGWFHKKNSYTGIDDVKVINLVRCDYSRTPKLMKCFEHVEVVYISAAYILRVTKS